VLYHEEIGRPGDPAVLLLPGLGRQLLDWDTAFCDSLAVAGMRVIRLDNRDSGLSPRHDTGKVNIADLLHAVRTGERYHAPYGLRDMADDSVRLMDALDLDSAHLVGTSMGAMIAQTMAATYPGRVRSLVSIMSTTGDREVGRPASREIAARLWMAPPRDRAAAISYAVTGRRLLHGDGRFDAAVARREEQLAYDRAFSPDGTGRQLAAVVAGGDRTPELAGVRAPTLVVHGTRDPLIDISGGRATATAIARARFFAVEGMGHELRMPPPYRAGILAAIVDHMAGRYW
jgi:pimeloyl-ACP methyl ester carboxylesterase